MISTKDLVEFLKFETLIFNNYLYSLGQSWKEKKIGLNKVHVFGNDLALKLCFPFKVKI